MQLRKKGSQQIIVNCPCLFAGKCILVFLFAEKKSSRTLITFSHCKNRNSAKKKPIALNEIQGEIDPQV